MYVGNKNRIDVSSSQFADFIEGNNLYVDKTAFVEHVSRPLCFYFFVALILSRIFPVNIPFSAK